MNQRKWKYPNENYILSRSIKILIQTLLLIVLIETRVTAQISEMSSSSGASAIFGVSPLQGDIGGQNLRDLDWGVLPSRQTLNANNNSNNFGRPASSSNNNPRTRPRSTNINGREVLVDANGNIRYDAQGQMIEVDNTVGTLDSNDPSLDATQMIFPDDPQDIPLDEGVCLLLVIGIGTGYRNKKGKKQKNSNA